VIPASVAISRTGVIGDPLPKIPAFEELHSGFFKWTPRGGQVTMVAGAPGTQKSGVAVYMATEWARVGIPGLYMSADMDRHTAITRSAAALSGHTIDVVTRAIESGAEDYYAEALNLPLHFSFNPSPTLGDLRLELEAWVEAWDTYPRFIVVDNLLDVIPDSGDSETTGYKAILLDLKHLARSTGAHILVLHHMSEFFGDTTMPAPRKFVMGKVSQSPENVLSLGFDPIRLQAVLSLVKHRNGPSSAGAEIVARLDADPERNTFRQHRIGGL